MSRFLLMLTITLCLALVSLVALGLFILITLGFAIVEMMRKKNISINKISFKGPVSTSAFSFTYFFLILIVKINNYSFVNNDLVNVWVPAKYQQILHWQFPFYFLSC